MRVRKADALAGVRRRDAEFCSRVEHVDSVETFLSVSSPHSLIMDSRSSTEGSDTFTHGTIDSNLAISFGSRVV